MERVKELLQSKGLNIDDLTTYEYGGKLHIGLLKEDESDPDLEYFTHIIFPTRESFITTLNYLENKKLNEDKSNLSFILAYREFLNLCVESGVSLEDIATYIWNIEESDTGLTEETIDKINEAESKLSMIYEPLFIDFCYYCKLLGLHSEHMIYNDENLESMFPMLKTNTKESSNNIFLDENTIEHYWFASLDDISQVNLNNFMYVLTSDEQEEAKTEIEKAKELLDNSDTKYINTRKLPVCTKMLTIILQEIISLQGEYIEPEDDYEDEDFDEEAFLASLRQ